MAVNGNNVGLYVEGTLIGCLTNCGFSSQNQEIDVTCKDNDGAKSVLPGGNEASMTFEGFFDPAASYGLQDLIAVHSDRTRVWVKMSYDSTDSLTVSGYAYLNDLSWDGPLNAGSTFSGTFTVDGTWTYSIT